MKNIMLINFAYIGHRITQGILVTRFQNLITYGVCEKVKASKKSVNTKNECDLGFLLFPLRF